MTRRTRWGSALDVAQHEAAHVVVGVALGLRLHFATIRKVGDRHAHATFFAGKRRRASLGIMYAAGIAWEREQHERSSSGDALALRQLGFTRTEQRALERAAAALLALRGGAHARVTRALLEDDLRPAAVARLARGLKL